MWNIFLHDLKRIFVNPVAIIVTIGIAILPSVYAWLNIIANWDPYGNTSELPVAVANLDQGGKSELTGSVNIGAKLTKTLKTNHQLGWKFVDTKSEAVQGVYSGKYYASIVINKNFSQQLINMLTQGAKQPELQYFVNEKLNAVAPKITDTGATTLERKINAAFVGTVTKTISKKLNISATKAKKLMQGAYSDSIEKIDGTIQTVHNMRDNLDSSRQDLTTTEANIADAKKALSDAQSLVKSAQATAHQSATTAQSAQKVASQFSTSSAADLNNAAASLSVLSVQAGQTGTDMSSSLSTVSSDISSVTANLTAIIASNNAAIAQLQSVISNSGLDENSQEYQTLKTALTNLQSLTQSQQESLNSFSSSAQKSLSSANTATSNLARSLSSAASSGSTALSSASSALSGSVGSSLSASLLSAASLAQATSTSLGQLSTALSQAQDVLDQLKNLLATTAFTMQSTEGTLDTVVSRLNTVRTDLAALDSSKIVQSLKDAHLNGASLGKFMQSPVSLVQKTVYPVENYGSAIAPFFTNVALWVGGFMLIAVMKIQVDRKKSRELYGKRRIRDRQAYMGRWLLFASIGAVQGLVAAVGDLVIGIQMKHPAAFIFAGVFTSVVYVSLIYALAATFKHVGKAMAMVLVVMQVPGSSGTYPIEIMPAFFRAVEPWLPFTYGINAMRETIGGYYDGYYAKNLSFLLLVLAFAFVLGLVARPYLLNLNALFDRRLAHTDLLVGDQPQESHARFRLRSVVQNMMGHEEFGKLIRRRAAHFAQIYPRLVVSGTVATLIVPIVFLVLLFTVDEKIVFLVLWLISVIALVFSLIALEYIREVYEREVGMSALSEAALRSQVLDRLARRWKKSRDDESTDDESADDGFAGVESADSASMDSESIKTTKSAEEGLSHDEK